MAATNSQHRQLGAAAFQRLREQMATAAALCSDEQVLDLADALHDALRRRTGRVRPSPGAERLSVVP